MEFDANTIIALVVPVLAPLITAGMKWLMPKIPKWAIPTLCTALGTLSAYIAQWATAGNQSLGVAIGLGLAGIGVREILDQLKPKETK